MLPFEAVITVESQESRVESRPTTDDCRPSTADCRLSTDWGARAHAVNPAENVVLEASAGTGKTRVLVERYVNLLLAGVEPEHILAITFTRKAAAEMRQRIVERLREAGRMGELDAARWRDLHDRLGDSAALQGVGEIAHDFRHSAFLEMALKGGDQLADFRLSKIGWRILHGCPRSTNSELKQFSLRSRTN